MHEVKPSLYLLGQLLPVAIHFNNANLHSPSDEVGAQDAAPDVRLQHGEELEERRRHLGLLHQDGDADQVVVGDGEVHHVLPLRHHGQGRERDIRLLRAGEIEAGLTSSFLPNVVSELLLGEAGGSPAL